MAQILGKKSIAILVNDTCITSSIDNHQRSTDDAHRSNVSTDDAHRSILSTDDGHQLSSSTDIAHQCKVLGTNKSMRGFCQSVDMFYQEALPKFWFVSRVDSLLTIGDRHR